MRIRSLLVALGLSVLLKVAPVLGGDPQSPLPVPVTPPPYNPGLIQPALTYGKPLNQEPTAASPQGLLSTEALYGPPPIPPPVVPWVPEPQMIGDLVSPFASVLRTEKVLLSVPIVGVPGPGFVAPANFTARIEMPIISPAAYKIADNESARPVDRVFVNFAFYNNFDRSANGFGGPPNAFLPTATGLTSFGPPLSTSNLGSNTAVGLSLIGQLANSSLFQPQASSYLQAALSQGNFVLSQPPPDIPSAKAILANASGSNFLTAKNVRLLSSHSSGQGIGAIISGVFVQSKATKIPISNLRLQGGAFDGSTGQSIHVAQTNLYREVFGFEKTFLDGNASIGLRAPILQYQGDGSLGQSDFGDLSLVLKYTFLNDPDRGTLASAGMVLTMPTGPDVVLAQGGSSLNPTLFQPYVAGLYSDGRFYAQGFSSVVMPTDWREVTVWFNDLGIGYQVYRSNTPAVLSGFAPTAEVHLNTPLNHRGFGSQPIGMSDSVNLTGGFHFTFFHRARFTVGVGGPVTSPHVADFNVFGQFNLIF